MNNDDFKIFFWGVRGSCPTFNKNMLEFGGNTSCIHIEIGDKIIIFDGGTGIQQLGNYLIDENKNIKGDIFISHTHWDHVQGLPFFTPFFNKNNEFNIYGQRKDNIPFSNVIKNIMKYPYSPINWDDMNAKFTFNEIESGNIIKLGKDIMIESFETDHPDGCLAYKIKYKNKACCYITDLEHDGNLEDKLRSFVKDADVLIYDSNYTDEEYIGKCEEDSKKGWGHSTWQKGVKLAKEAKVKSLFLFHHNTNRSDNELKIIESKAKELFKNTVAAREGMIIDI